MIRKLVIDFGCHATCSRRMDDKPDQSKYTKDDVEGKKVEVPLQVNSGCRDVVVAFGGPWRMHRLPFSAVAALAALSAAAFSRRTVDLEGSRMHRCCGEIW